MNRMEFLEMPLCLNCNSRRTTKAEQNVKTPYFGWSFTSPLKHYRVLVWSGSNNVKSTCVIAIIFHEFLYDHSIPHLTISGQNHEIVRSAIALVIFFIFSSSYISRVYFARDYIFSMVPTKYFAHIPANFLKFDVFIFELWI